MGKTIDIDIGIGIATIHDNYLITVMHEGVTVSVESNKILIDLANQYFINKPFVYITHRKNSYGVDPSIYKETRKIKNFTYSQDFLRFVCFYSREDSLIRILKQIDHEKSNIDNIGNWIIF